MKFKSHILILFSFLITQYVIGQELTLVLSSIDSLENSVLKKIDFKKKHPTQKSTTVELKLISETLKNRGYFLNSLDSIVKTKDTIHKAYFSLNKKIEKAVITTSLTPIKKESIPIEKLTNFLYTISSKLENEGKLFSEVSLQNIFVNENILFANLNILPSNERKADKIIIEGYPKLSQKHIQHFLGLNRNTIINNDELKKISTNTKQLKFISEIKPPEILFKKDSTLLYLYLKKEKNNSFDGIINFTSKENDEGVLFTGHLNLELNNIFDTGEKFNLIWEANGEERQNFSVGTKLPYLFNSPLTTKANFKIHKQDSSFLSTSIKTNLSYNLNRKTAIGITYDSENSQNTLTNKIDESFQDFNNVFFGLSLSRNSNTFFFSINPSLGYRYNNDIKENQFKINFESSYLYEINKKNAIFIRNKIGYLDTKSNLTNELFRIGGANSIRGFDEESIFTSEFGFLNLEYRYATSLKSYFYSITDFGIIKNNQTENFTGIGLGYSLTVNNLNLNIAYAFGNRNLLENETNNSKIIISLKSFF